MRNAHPTHSPSRRVLLAMLLAPAFAARVPAASDDAVRPVSSDLVPLATLRTPTTAIVQTYGPPSEVVAPDLWVYWNFPTRSRAARRAGYDTLTVRVDRDEVVEMRLVNGDTLRRLLAAHRAALAALSPAVGNGRLAAATSAPPPR